MSDLRVSGSAHAGETVIELRVWQNVTDAGDTWISARTRGGRWDELGTIPFPLDTHGFSMVFHSFHWFRDLSIADTELRVWQRHRAPELIFVRACVTPCAKWLTPFTQTNPRLPREVAEAWPGVEVGWHPLGMIPLPLDDGHSSSGRYRYGDLTVSVPVGNPGLASDREHLLALRDALAGTATLDWSAGTPTREWAGVTASGSPRRVTGLDLADRGLDGEIWGWLGDLEELTELRLEGNRLTGAVPSKLALLTKLRRVDLAGNALEGCVPPRLRAAALHDLALAGLPDCALPTLLASSVWLLHDGSAAASYRWAHFAVSSVFDLPSGLEFTIEQLIGSDNDMDWSDCPPCHSNAYALTGNDLSIRPLGKFDYNSGLWSGPWPGPWLLLSSYGDDLGEVWERSHYAEDDAEVFAILEQVAASVWVHAPGTHEGEWTWP